MGGDGAGARDAEGGAGPVERTVSLGPGLGQCCGGAVTLRFEPAEALERPQGAPVWIWGAGHVGRALVDTLGPLAGRRAHWVDTSPGAVSPMHHPGGRHAPGRCRSPRLMPHAPPDAHHLILTYSHDIDLALCDAALRRGFATCGLIGSATKWARFRSRLEQDGAHGC
jgi:xanthine dehydrogenase accessory factor